MTLFIPDISHHQAGIDIQALKTQGAAALIARVGQAAGRRANGQQYGTVQDREWSRHRDEARRVGLPLIAYWYVGNLISPTDNANLAASWVGDPAIPWMIDHEDASGDAAFYCATVEAFRRRGLHVVLGYVPNWYWASTMRSASLTCGPPLVNSRYSTLTGTPASIYNASGGDFGRGWVNYGGQTTLLWQFTNQAQMAGRLIDCSAFKGTPADLQALINPDTRKEQSVTFLGRNPADGSIYVGDLVTRRHLPTQQDVEDVKFVASKAATAVIDLGDIQNVNVLGADLMGTLADDETKIVDAVRGIVAADADGTLQVSDAQVQQLADAVVAAVPPQVAEAVRQAFARAGQQPAE